MKKITAFCKKPVPAVQIKDKLGNREWFNLYGCKLVDQRQKIVEVIYKKPKSKHFNKELCSTIVDIHTLVTTFKKREINYNKKQYRKIRMPDLMETFLCDEKEVASRLGIKPDALNSMTDGALAKRKITRVGFYNGKLLYVIF